MSFRVAFVAEGNAETRDCWSGCAQGFVRALRRLGVTVDVFDVELKGLSRLFAGASAYRRDPAKWRAAYTFGAASYSAKSRNASALLAGRRVAYDAIIQIGGSFRIDPRIQPGVPRIIYSDANIRFAARGRPFASINCLSEEQLKEIGEREASVYETASRIWTMSASVAESFRNDFGIEHDRVLPIYAGANTEPPSAKANAASDRVPRILFVGKDHRRKGSEVLIGAMQRVREKVPNAEVHFVGCVPTEDDIPGVVCHGFIAAGTPEGKAQLQELFGSATVYCLPSRYEPFGVSFVEGMLAELPCIGSRQWAMPEIIEEGETGWLIPDGDQEALASVLIEALQNPERSRAMGKAGRERALRLFTWDRVAERAVADLQRLRSAPRQARAS